VVDQVAAERTISFGPFRLLPDQRLLLEAERQVRLGSRALEILVALAEQPGKVVDKNELIARVWPNTVVEESNLKFQISALRRTLGDGHGSNRYLATIPGRGYCFVAPLRIGEERTPPRPEATATSRPHNLPAQLARLIGRAGTVSRLAAQLVRHRLLTIVGPGGIGKTSVALAVAEERITAHENGVWLIDLAPLSDPRLVPAALAAALDLEIRSENPLPRLIEVLKDRQILLVLDNCEHVIDAAAALAAAVLRSAPGAHILATSREPLRIEGEHVHRLLPLASPPASAGLAAAEALGFPAVQLFVERAAASLFDSELSDADAPIAADICRRLDGSAGN
jgi:DNA-binding winged helix-turn-helix (wHTH) protein